jgi:putative transposase
MGLRFKDQVLGECFFVTTSFHGHKRYGDVPGVYEALCDSLSFYIDRYGTKLPGFVLMPTHIHLLLVITGQYLGCFMRDYKKYVAQVSIRDCSVTDSPVWQPRYDRVAIYSEAVFRQKLDYIHRNPVKAGLVTGAHEWKWSSAGAYLGDREPPVPIWTDWRF